MANQRSPNRSRDRGISQRSLDADLRPERDSIGCCHCVSERRWCFPIMDTVDEQAEFVGMRYCTGSQ